LKDPGVEGEPAYFQAESAYLVDSAGNEVKQLNAGCNVVNDDRFKMRCQISFDKGSLPKEETYPYRVKITAGAQIRRTPGSSLEKLFPFATPLLDVSEAKYYDIKLVGVEKKSRRLAYGEHGDKWVTKEYNEYTFLLTSGVSEPIEAAVIRPYSFQSGNFWKFPIIGCSSTPGAPGFTCTFKLKDVTTSLDPRDPDFYAAPSAYFWVRAESGDRRPVTPLLNLGERVRTKDVKEPAFTVPEKWVPGDLGFELAEDWRFQLKASDSSGEEKGTKEEEAPGVEIPIGLGAPSTPTGVKPFGAEEGCSLNAAAAANPVALLFITMALMPMAIRRRGR
jgi:hypothetical protein